MKLQEKKSIKKGSNLNKNNILIVDDDTELNEGLTELLKNEGYAVCSVNNGLEALKEAGCQTFDLIILDYKMEGMSGLEVLIKLKKTIPKVKVIFISGNPFIEKIVGKYDLSENILCALSKPFNIEIFLDAVKKACR